MPTAAPHRPRLRLLGALLLAVGPLGACARPPDVVLYCALDQVFAEPLVRRFEAETGLRVLAEYDIEANKTVGLVRRIREEARRPRCDVFWNNEFAHTVSLARDGLLLPYRSPNALDIPGTFRDPDGLWTGFAARARVYIVNTQKVDPSSVPGMWDLVDPKWKGLAGMARPLTGTTLTHMAALFEVLGEDPARRYLAEVRERGVSLTSGNATLMRLVAEGQLGFGWTDTDDYNVARLNGAPVEVVFPDADGIGTLFIPNTVCILAGAPRPEAAKKLVDWILSESVERELAASRSAQIPLHASLRGAPHQLPLERMKPMQVDYAAVGARIDERAQELKEMFLD